MKCTYRDIDCPFVDTSDMTKPDCSGCKYFLKKMKVAMIASIPEREQMLERTVESLRPQVDEIRVALNEYSKIPAFLNKHEVVMLDNEKGDAGKHYFADQFEGYLLSCDDDLIYPPDYVEKMIAGVDQYKCACTLHGRVYNYRPILNFQMAFIGYPCLSTVQHDTRVDIGGDGVMCWHTDFLKIRYEDFKSKNMSQLWFSKQCIEQGVKIMCLAHGGDYLTYQGPKWTIWDESAKNGFKEQTELMRTFLK